MKKILVILGHPQKDSFCGALANTYIGAAERSGKDVKSLNLGELDFDPVLWNGYNKIQELESDLVNAQKAIEWADHLVFVYPTWWGAMPALLKGFFERVFLPGFAFRYRDNSIMWDKLLVRKSAQLIVTMDTPLWYYRWVYRMPGHNQMKRTILQFSGIKPVKVTSFGPIKSSNRKQRVKWLNSVKKIAVS